MVRSSLVDAVIGLLAFTTGTSTRPSLAPSVTRAATPMPATSVAQTSAIATTFRWVMRSAPSIEKLFISPSPEVPCSLVAPAGKKVHGVRQKKMGSPRGWLGRGIHAKFQVISVRYMALGVGGGLHRD